MNKDYFGTAVQPDGTRSESNFNASKTIAIVIDANSREEPKGPVDIVTTDVEDVLAEVMRTKPSLRSRPGTIEVGGGVSTPAGAAAGEASLEVSASLLEQFTIDLAIKGGDGRSVSRMIDMGRTQLMAGSAALACMVALDTVNHRNTLRKASVLYICQAATESSPKVFAGGALLSTLETIDTRNDPLLGYLSAPRASDRDQERQLAALLTEVYGNKDFTALLVAAARNLKYHVFGRESGHLEGRWTNLLAPRPAHHGETLGGVADLANMLDSAREMNLAQRQFRLSQAREVLHALLRNPIQRSAILLAYIGAHVPLDDFLVASSSGTLAAMLPERPAQLALIEALKTATIDDKQEFRDFVGMIAVSLADGSFGPPLAESERREIQAMLKDFRLDSPARLLEAEVAIAAAALRKLAELPAITPDSICDVEGEDHLTQVLTQVSESWSREPHEKGEFVASVANGLRTWLQSRFQHGAAKDGAADPDQPDGAMGSADATDVEATEAHDHARIVDGLDQNKRAIYLSLAGRDAALAFVLQHGRSWLNEHEYDTQTIRLIIHALSANLHHTWNPEGLQTREAPTAGALDLLDETLRRLPPAEYLRPGRHPAATYADLMIGFHASRARIVVENRDLLRDLWNIANLIRAAVESRWQGTVRIYTRPLSQLLKSSGDRRLLSEIPTCFRGGAKVIYFGLTSKANDATAATALREWVKPLWSDGGPRRGKLRVDGTWPIIVSPNPLGDVPGLVIISPTTLRYPELPALPDGPDLLPMMDMAVSVLGLPKEALGSLDPKAYRVEHLRKIGDLEFDLEASRSRMEYAWRIWDKDTTLRRGYIYTQIVNIGRTHPNAYSLPLTETITPEYLHAQPVPLTLPGQDEAIELFALGQQTVSSIKALPFFTLSKPLP